MTVEQMREFVVLAEERNYLVAADLLFSTQATLSRHIMAMEDELGFVLFNRSTKKIELTSDGNRFLLYARNAVRIQDNYLKAIEQAKREDDATLNVGYNALVVYSHFTEPLSDFMAAYPTVKMKIKEYEHDDLVRAVRDGECEIAFVQENPFDPLKGLNSIPISTDYVTAVFSTSHPYASHSSVTLEDLRNEHFICSMTDEMPGKMMIQACRNAGYEPMIARSGLVASSMYEWIAKKGGTGLDISTPAGDLKNAGIRLVPIEPQITTHVLMIYRKDGLSASGRQLVSFFRNIMRSGGIVK